MSDPLVRVFGTYQDAAGRPMTGSVTFTPDIYAPDDTPGTALKSQQKVVARLDSQGYFEVDLTASDDSGWRTDGVSIPYRVDERVPGIDRQRLVFVLKPGPVDLNTQPDAPIDYDGPVEVPVPGLPGPPNVLTIGEVETLPAGEEATATITGTSPAQVLNLGLPAGDDSTVPGPQGEVAVDSTATGPPGSAAQVEDLDPSPNRALLKFTIPEGQPGADSTVPGPQGEVAVDSTVTGAAGTQALVEDLDPSPNRALLKFTIPKGDKGEQAEIEVGSTATGAPGSQAAVTDSDPSPHKSVLEFTIPKGDKGDQGEVAVDSTVTGAPGSAAQVEDLDPSPNRALLKFTIPRGDVGATGPAIGGILTTKGDLVARDATTAVRVPVGAPLQVLTPDPAAPAGVKWGPVPGVGNLLAENQASGTDTLGDTTGFTPDAVTLASDATQFVQGARSLSLTHTGTGVTGVFLHGSTTSGTLPVAAGASYTFRYLIKSSAAESFIARIMWWTAAGNVAASTPNSDSPVVITSTSAWSLVSVTATAPANASFASFYVRRHATGATGTVHYVDALGFWRGAGGDWAMPGTPITGLQSSWEQVALLADLPATGNWLGRKIQVTSGLGLQVMVWNGTVWVVAPESDTGWRAVTLANAWTATAAEVRRVGPTMVWLNLTSASGATASSTTLYTLPAGWRPNRIHNAPIFKEPAPATLGTLNIAASGVVSVVLGTAATYTGIRCQIPVASTDTWPTVAPS